MNVKPSKLVAIIAIIGVAIGTTLDAEDKPKDEYYVVRYQWTVFISEGRCAAGPEKFAVFKGKPNVKLLAEKFPKRDDDKPAFATHATDKIVEVPVFGNFTPITKEQYEIAVKSKTLSLELP